MRRARFEPEVNDLRQVVRTVDLVAMQDEPAKWVHRALKLLNLTSNLGSGLRIKIFGLQGIPSTPPDGEVTVTKGAGALGTDVDSVSPIVELLADTVIFILDDATVITETPPVEINLRSVEFAGALTAVEPGFKLKETPTASEKNVLKVQGQLVFVDEDMAPDAAPTLAATIRKPGKPADPSLARKDIVSIAPVTLETDDLFADADESITFIDTGEEEAAPAREVTQSIRTRFDDGFVIRIRQGEPAVDPLPPVVPSTELPLFNVTVGIGATTIGETDIEDLGAEGTQFDDRFPLSFFDIVAAENLDELDIIRIRKSDGKALKADFLNRENAKTIGIIPVGGGIDILTNPKGKAAHLGIFDKVGAGFQPGRFLYLLSDGKFGHDDAFLASSQRFKVPVGMAITTEKFFFFGGRRLTAFDVPVEDTAANFTSNTVEGALAELAAAQGASLKFIKSVYTTSADPVVSVPANAAPTFLYIVTWAQVTPGGAQPMQYDLLVNGPVFTPAAWPAGPLQDNIGFIRTNSAYWVLEVANGDYDPTIINTLQRAQTQGLAPSRQFMAVFGA